MHRFIRDHLEEVLAESAAGAHRRSPHEAHFEECEECRAEVAAMREQAALIRELRAAAEPRPGFYARVMERIETQGARSIWNLFFESPFGRRIPVASMALALFFGVYLVTSEQYAEEPVQIVAGEDQPGLVLPQMGAADR